MKRPYASGPTTKSQSCFPHLYGNPIAKTPNGFPSSYVEAYAHSSRKVGRTHRVLSYYMRMQSFISLAAFLIILTATSILYPSNLSAQQAHVSFQVFYDELSPYGDWVDYPNYGYVWVPSVGMDFTPYSSNGHWVLTEYGWTWYSNYSWGWAPFHYGRWFHDSYYGWVWLPDNEWGPSWVTWRRANGYYGWAPMGPNVSISVSFGRPYNQNDYWVFVSERDFGRPNVHRHHVSRSDRDRIIINSIVINNTYTDNRYQATYISGPTRQDVQRSTGRQYRAVPVKEHSKPGQSLNNRQLQIYRPQVIKGNDKGQTPRPPRVSNQKDVKPPDERNPQGQQQKARPSSRPEREKSPARAKPSRNERSNQQKEAEPRKGRKRGE